MHMHALHCMCSAYAPLAPVSRGTRTGGGDMHACVYLPVVSRKWEVTAREHVSSAEAYVASASAIASALDIADEDPDRRGSRRCA